MKRQSRIVPYDPVYQDVFLLVEKYVRTRTKGVEAIHIGRTAVPDLRGKPMVDVAAVTARDDLRAEQKEFEKLGYTGVAVVDGKHQIVVHAEAYGEGQEHGLLIPMIKGAREHFGADPFKDAAVLADAGYCGEENA